MPRTIRKKRRPRRWGARVPCIRPRPRRSRPAQPNVRNGALAAGAIPEGGPPRLRPAARAGQPPAPGGRAGAFRPRRPWRPWMCIYICYNIYNIYIYMHICTAGGSRAAPQHAGCHWPPRGRPQAGRLEITPVLAAVATLPPGAYPCSS